MSTDHHRIDLPRHINLTIEHMPNATSYQTVEEWLRMVDALDAVDIEPEDLAEIVHTGNLWVISWHPDTPVGSHSLAAASLERALELANGDGYR